MGEERLAAGNHGQGAVVDLCVDGQVNASVGCFSQAGDQRQIEMEVVEVVLRILDLVKIIHGTVRDADVVDREFEYLRLFMRLLQ